MKARGGFAHASRHSGSPQLILQGQLAPFLARPALRLLPPKPSQNSPTAILAVDA
jgi:hypothetical protein